jgi:hypothetical protein
LARALEGASDAGAISCSSASPARSDGGGATLAEARQRRQAAAARPMKREHEEEAGGAGGAGGVAPTLEAHRESRGKQPKRELDVGADGGAGATRRARGASLAAPPPPPPPPIAAGGAVGAAFGAAGPSGAAAAPAPAAALAAAAPPSAAAAAPGHFEVHGVRYASCAAVQAAVAPGDVVELHGCVRGPLELRVDGVQLRGCTPDAALLAPRDADAAAPTLLVTANGVHVKALRVHGMRKGPDRVEIPTVLVKPAGAAVLVGFVMDDVSVLGGGGVHGYVDVEEEEEDADAVEGKDEGKEKKKVRYGHPGVELCAGVRGAALTDVFVYNVSGDAVRLLQAVTATLTRVAVTRAAYIGFWLRAAGKCTLLDCRAVVCGENGAYIDTGMPCELIRFSALSCADSGVTFDVPSRAEGLLSDEGLAALRLTPHMTQARASHLTSVRSCTACGDTPRNTARARHSGPAMQRQRHLRRGVQERRCGVPGRRASDRKRVERRARGERHAS